MTYDINMQRLQNALNYISPDQRDAWVRQGMAIKAELGDDGFDIWDEWGSKGKGHNASAARSVWNSFKKSSIGIGTVFFDAKEAGWKDDSKFKKPTAERAVLRAARLVAEAEREAIAAADAAKRADIILKGSTPAPDDYPYLVRKGVGAHGLRLGSWEWFDEETGEMHSSPDHLIIPLRDRQKKVHSLQFIDPTGKKKRYLRGGAKQGHFFALGSPRQHAGQPVYVLAEGYATAASVHEATGHLVLTCFDASNLLPVAQAIRARRPDAVLVVAADNDVWTKGNPGMTAAKKTADAVRGLMCAPPFTPAHQSGVDDKGEPVGPSDWNDWHLASGAESVAAFFNAALAGSQAVTTTISLVASVTASDSEEDEIGIIVLGATPARLYFFWRQDTQKVEALTGAELGKHQGLQRLADTQRWETWGSGKFTPTLATNYLINKALQIGDVDLTRVPDALCPAKVVRREYLSTVAHTSGKNPAPAVVAEMLALDSRWSNVLIFDELALRPVVFDVPPCGGAAGYWTDNHDAQLAAWLYTHYGLNLSVNLVKQIVNFLASQNRIHPVRKYLAELSWDKVPRLDTWLIDLAGAPDTPFVRAVSSKTLIAAVARVFEPGCKADTALVLEGSQGVGKSSFLRALMPNKAWFAEDLGGPIGKKDALIGLAGKWIIELAEIAAMKKSTSEDVKSFLSRLVDSFRAPYATRSEDHPRQCVFFGTVNPEADGTWLNDTTGGRRFWPVVVSRCDVSGMTAVRDQLWAEALHRYQANEPHFLTQEIEKMAAIEQEHRLEGNPWEESVNSYLNMHPGCKKISTNIIFENKVGRVTTSKDRAESRAIAKALRSRGWVSDREGSGRVRIWEAPSQVKDELPI